MVLPLAVRRFLLIGVPTVPYLEALLLRTDATSALLEDWAQGDQREGPR